MGEKWYDDLPDDAFITETDKAYEKAASKIREGLSQGLDFDSACAEIEIEDQELKMSIIDDVMKVIIAEEHFGKNIPLDEIAKKFKISVDRLESSKLSMMDDVKNSSIKAFYKGLGSGNA